MTCRSSWVVVFAALVLASACTDAISPSSAGSGTGGTATTPSCYLSRSGDSCECVASNEDDSRPSADWTKVTACNETTAKSPLTCTVDTKVDGTTTSCTCIRFRCAVNGGRCACGTYAEGETVASCTDFEWYCGADDKTACFGGNGTYGSACGNEEHNIPSCSMANVVRPDDVLASCDGLRFVAPAPSSSTPTPDGDDKCTGCSSDSDCHDECLRCDRTTCSCVHRLSC
jgi:hypothetical protein